jgi:hypothetical protein
MALGMTFGCLQWMGSCWIQNLALLGPMIRSTTHKYAKLDSSGETWYCYQGQSSHMDDRAPFQSDMEVFKRGGLKAKLIETKRHCRRRLS